MPNRKPASRAKKAAPRRAAAPSRGGNPLGLLIVLAGAAGLVYISCGPHPTAPSPPPPSGQTAVQPVVPRRRYEPPKPRMQVEEQAPRDETPRPADKVASGIEGPVGGADDVPPLRKEIVEPEVKLAPDAPPAPAPAPAPAPQPAIRLPRAPRGEFDRNPQAAGTVALSFDGCYDDKPLPQILSALDRRGYKATFFIAGRFAQRYPRSVKLIADDGMELGNHSWSHPKFTSLTDAQIDSQLSRTNDLIREISGQTPTLFRPPFGDRDARVRRQVAAEGFRTVCWALDSWDSVKKGITSDEIATRVLDRVKPGDVVLLHIGSEATAGALPQILDGLDARGLKVVPVSDLMK